MGRHGRTDSMIGRGSAGARARTATLPWYDERSLFRILLALLLLLFCFGNPAIAAPAAEDDGKCPGATACGSEEETEEGGGKSCGCGGGCEKAGGCEGHRATCVCSAVGENFAPTMESEQSPTTLPLAGTIHAPSPEDLPSIILQPPVPPPRSS